MRATESLREREQQFRSILDKIRIGIIIVAVRNRVVVYVNPTAVEMIGSSADEIIGCDCYEVLGPNDEELCSILDLCQEIDSSEHLLLACDGRQIPILKTITRITFRGQECLLESFIDLTAPKRSAKEKAELEARLRQAQKMEALGTLAGGIAHDFNDILSAVIGYAELGCLDLGDNSHNLHRKLTAILDAGKRAKELVAQTLTFSRMQEQTLTPLSVAPIVKGALNLLKASLPARITLELHIETHRKVLADPTQIHQIIMNLCANAYHAMEEEGGRLSIALTAIVHDGQTMGIDLPPGEYLNLSVEDTGMGIPAKVLESIFDPYFITKDKGTGLGPAVVHGIVKSHGGAISVKSGVGEGTIIRVLLPTTEDETVAVEQKSESGLFGGTERILIVDDDSELVEVSSQMLRRLGCRVTCAVGSLNALAVFKQNPDQFDLVITDMNMPAMMGDRLAQEIIGIRADIPIILCTGFTDRIDPKGALSIDIRNF